MAARRDPLLDRALLESATKYGPQGGALRSLLQELAGSYGRTRRVNNSSAIGITAATQQARPDVQQAFDQALQSGGAQRAALGVGADDPQAAAYQRRVGEQKAGALTDLTQREVRAEEGRIFANSSARQEYVGGKEKILGQLRELEAQQGAETAARYGSLRDDQLERGVKRRGQDITARGQDMTARSQANSLAARETAAAKAKQKAKAFKPASPEAHARARGAIEEAIAQVSDMRLDARGRPDPSASRADIIALLVKGVPAGKDEDGNTVPAIPKLPADLVRAATNLVFDGTLSRKDVERLHNLKLRIRTLGYPTRKKRQRSAVDLATGTGGTAAGMSSRPPVPGLR